MAFSLDDLPSFLAAIIGVLTILAGSATAAGVHREVLVIFGLFVSTVVGPTILGVGPPGLLSVVAYWLHAVQRTGAFTPESKRKFDYDEIRSGLLLGRQPRNFHDLERLRKEGITGLVTLNQRWELFIDLGEFRATLEKHGIEHLHIETADFQGPQPESTVKAVEFLANHIRKHRAPGKVYVHCNAGRGRSALVLAAYLLAADYAARSPGDEWDPAAEVQRVFGEMRAKRPQVSLGLTRYPLTGQSRALRHFATSDAPSLGEAWRKHQ